MVQIRFGVRASPSLTGRVVVRPMRLAVSRLTRDGVIIITAERFRDHQRNRVDAREPGNAGCGFGGTAGEAGALPKPGAGSKEHGRAGESSGRRLNQPRRRSFGGCLFQNSEAATI